MPLHRMSYEEKIEKIYEAQTNSHLLDEKGLAVVKQRFIEECFDKNNNFNPESFEKFIQLLHNEIFRNGLLFSLTILQEPYNR